MKQLLKLDALKGRKGALPTRPSISFRGLLVWGVTGAAAGAAISLLAIFLGPFRTNASRGLPARPILTVVAYPTATLASATLLAPEVTPTSTAESKPAPPGGGDFTEGELVEIFGTDGEGLRLRSTPSLEALINGLGLDHEVFEVRQGPQEADGYTWWLLVSLSDSSRQGWAVSNYLRKVDTQ